MTAARAAATTSAVAAQKKFAMVTRAKPVRAAVTSAIPEQLVPGLARPANTMMAMRAAAITSAAAAQKKFATATRAKPVRTAATSAIPEQLALGYARLTTIHRQVVTIS